MNHFIEMLFAMLIIVLAVIGMRSSQALTQGASFHVATDDTVLIRRTG